jgi:O-antigen ligase
LVIYLPYLLFIDNKLVKPLLVILFLFVIFLSVKRTALLSGLLFLIFLILIQLTKSKRLLGKLGTWVGIIIIALVSFFIISRNYSESVEVVVERFADVDDDGGSGRDVVYDLVLDGISQSDIDGVIFGNGYDAVSKKLIGHPAHNDFLEIIYDNGIIVVMFYIIFIILLIRQVIKRKRLKQQYLILLFCLLNYLLVSSLNCVITNPLFIFVIMTSMGLALGVTNDTSVLDNEKVS